MDEEREITAGAVLAEYARIAFADIRQVVRWSDEGISLVSSEELDEDTARAIAEVRTAPGTGGQRQVLVKQHGKLEALNKLADYLQLFKHAVTMQHTGPNGESLPGQQLSFNFHGLATEDLETLERIAGQCGVGEGNGINRDGQDRQDESAPPGVLRLEL
ncbi:MAG: terminase small subunit [Armatimonadota bacterium]